MQIFIRTYLSSDAAQINLLQKRYTAVYPDAPIVPEAVYGIPSFDQGRNIFCAFSEEGQLIAYAPMLLEMAAQPSDPGRSSSLPHRVWVEVKADPGIANTELINRYAARKARPARPQTSQVPGKMPGGDDFPVPSLRDPRHRLCRLARIHLQRQHFFHESQPCRSNRANSAAPWDPNPELEDGKPGRTGKLCSGAQ